ncbi:MAG: hypothetical protein H0X25_04745 [Acidobacteriales bacterium]|nr:hypothetical protein [Terriglobales bacterium]
MKKLGLSGLAVILLAGAVPGLQMSGNWTVTGAIAKYATAPSSSVMRDGKVLTAGGNLGGVGAVFPWAQVYDPVANKWTATPDMKSPRNGLSGTTLPSGKVLLAGGSNGGNGVKLTILTSAELYDPAKNNFTLARGKMAVGRMYHSATLMGNGKVLLAGGINGYYISIRYITCTNTAEVYDPATQTFSSAGTLSAPRCGHTATLLPDGRVMVAGGTDGKILLNTADIYDPATNTWTAGANMSVARDYFSAAVLSGGKVLVTGPDTSAEIFDPVSNTWTTAGGTQFTYGANAAATLLNGEVLLVGGPAGQCELYDPTTGLWNSTGTLNTARWQFGISVLRDGRVLITDGETGFQVGSAELYRP